MALAGTAPINQKSVILKNAKLQKEQGFVSDHYLNFFTKQNIEYTLDSPKVEKFQDLVHIKQSINFKYNGNETELLSGLSPTPAVGVHPRTYLEHTWNNFLFNNIAEFDMYGGVFHKTDEIESDAVVMIRKLTWNKNRVLIHAGCGVIEESSYLEELEESKLKIANVMRLFL